MPVLTWDEGTAYDLFVSLYVLHRPEAFGVRPSWAAGVRSRLPVAQRDFLEQIETFLPVPLSWLYLLPAEAKNAAGALSVLAQLPAAERLSSLLITADTPIEAINALQKVTLRQTWSSAEQEVLRATLTRKGIQTRPSTMNHLCLAWSDLTASGEKLLQALNSYYQVFFKEEEQRIIPSLRAAVTRAQAIAPGMTADRLLTELSHGVYFEQVKTAEEIILVPSYWSSPLVFYGRLWNEQQQATNRLMVLYGSRPEAHDLVPGGELPDDLMEALKAIADPTRLRILRYLSGGPLTPSELARRLRLRPPTVIHHLNTLRLAGLVEVILHAEGERGYSIRREALSDSISLLVDFLMPDPE